MPVAGPRGAIVFTDIVGFTEFTAHYGDELAVALVDRQEELVIQALPAGARIVKQLGDGLLLFYPEVASALDVSVGLLARYEEESTDELPLWVRTGLHYGRPRARGDDLIGHDVNLAARIVELAAPGEVMLTADAVEQLPEPRRRDCQELGPVFVKGIPDPVQLFRVAPPD